MDNGGLTHFFSGGTGAGSFVTVNVQATVYRGASTNSQPIGTANAGDILPLLDDNIHNGMYKVLFQGLLGFIPINEVTVGGTPPAINFGQQKKQGGQPTPTPGPGTSTSVLPQVQDDHFVFYYHTDHLGSTGYVTDREGKLSENVQYFPFGETWVEQRRGMSPFPDYLFSGKELDQETGLLYFGARYYDPRTSVWQSSDSALVKYLPGSNFDSRFSFSGPPRWEFLLNLPGGGGIYESKNLGLYSYTQNNPLILIDPNGLTPDVFHFSVEFGLTIQLPVIKGPGGFEFTTPGFALGSSYEFGNGGTVRAKTEFNLFKVGAGGYEFGLGGGKEITTVENGIGLANPVTKTTPFLHLGKEAEVGEQGGKAGGELSLPEGKLSLSVGLLFGKVKGEMDLNALGIKMKGAAEKGLELMLGHDLPSQNTLPTSNEKSGLRVAGADTT